MNRRRINRVTLTAIIVVHDCRNQKNIVHFNFVGENPWTGQSQRKQIVLSYTNNFYFHLDFMSK